MKKIYLDYAATTPTDVKVVEKLLPYFSDKFGNPSSLHAFGKEVKNDIKEARKVVAKALNVQANKIIFTSGGTESINLGIRGVVSKGDHIITSKIEHAAVLQTCKYLEGKGIKVTYLKVNSKGIIDLNDLEKSIRKDTKLITIQYANNEIGSIQPIEKIKKIAKKHNILLHIDASQAINYCDIVDTDLLSFSGSKIYGPKGIGVLMSKVKVNPIVFGGSQEDGIRSGTENVPGIIGISKALEIVGKKKESEVDRLIKLKKYFIKELKKFDNIKINGSIENSLPNIINVSFVGLEAESILLHLSQQGIFVSSGSACSSNKIGISHVLKAINCNKEEAIGSIRFSFGRFTTKIDLQIVISKLKIIINSLRKI